MSLDQTGYLALPQIIDAPQTALYRQVILHDAQQGHLAPDTTVPTALAGRDNGMLVRLHKTLRPKMEELTGKRLFRTYVYYRIYGRGDTLHKHKDRPACEFSITLNLGGESTVVWPIYVHSQGRDVPVDLSPGDAMLYKGCEVMHWREAYTGNQQVQAFMHFVDRDGPYAAHKDDVVELQRLGNS